MTLACELWDEHGPLLRTTYPGSQPPPSIWRYPMSKPPSAWGRDDALGRWVEWRHDATRRPERYDLRGLDRDAVIFIYHKAPALTTTVPGWRA